MRKYNIRKCYICNSTSFERVKGRVRDLPQMPILKCKQCGLIFLENFDHISENFYEKSLMRGGKDIKTWELYLRECAMDDTRRVRALKKNIVGKRVLDFGCGCGGFLIKSRNLAKSCSGVEKDNRLRVIIAKRFKIRVYADIEEIKEKFDVITLFHVLEHFKEPKDILIKLSRLLSKGGKIIIEVPNSNDALLSLYENKEFMEFTYWKCHLYLFNDSNLRKLLKDSGLSVDSISQIQRYPLSNHLYWLSKGKPGGHKLWNFIDNRKLNKEYEAQLSKFKACDTLIALAAAKHKQKKGVEDDRLRKIGKTIFSSRDRH